MTDSVAEAIERRFSQLCSQVGRCGVIGFAPVDAADLLPQQEAYLRRKLQALFAGRPLTAVSIGLMYREDEVLAIPGSWQVRAQPQDAWNRYARAYAELNRLLNQVAGALADEFGGVAEQATMQGWTGKVNHVNDYFGHCVSHRSFAEAAGLGWRGRHGLIVTPEVGPALRFATVFVSQDTGTRFRQLPGCGECRACIVVCPILDRASQYREACRRRLVALDLEDEVCGICVRACWQHVTRYGA